MSIYEQIFGIPFKGSNLFLDALRSLRLASEMLDVPSDLDHTAPADKRGQAIAYITSGFRSLDM